MTESRSQREAAVQEPVAAPDITAEEAAMSDAEPAVTELSDVTGAPEAVVDAAPEPDAAPAMSAAPADAPEPEAPETGTQEAQVPPEGEGAPAAESAPEADAEAGEPIAAAVAEPTEEPAVEPAPERQPRERDRKPAAAAEPDAPAPPPGPRGLQLRYRSDVIPALIKQFEYANPNQVPRLEKIVVNIDLGEALTNAKAIDAASSDLTMITGQKPIVMKARRSIAQFKIRTGNPIGLKVTLRGQRMWDFLERMTMLALPRIRDFRGTPSRSFDGRGNYTLGLREQIAFPEIDYDKVDRLRGLEISIVTTAKSDEESKRLLELLGMPFAG